MPGRRRLLRVAALAGLWGLLAAVGLGAAPAAAHNQLRASSPADGRTLDRVPDAVVLTFDEPVLALGTGLVVTGPAGEIQDGEPRVVDDQVIQQLRDDAPAGAYRVTWRATSADGHPIGGAFSFTATQGRGGSSSAPVEPSSASAAPVEQSDPATPDDPSGPAARWLLAGGALGTAGVLLATALRWRRRRP